MIIEGSVSLETEKLDPSNMETTIKASSIDEISFIRSVSFESRENADPLTESNTTSEQMAALQTVKGTDSILKLIVRLQRLYKIIRRLRQLADDAVLREQKWFKLLDDHDLKRNSELFFDIGKPNSVLSRWQRGRKRLSKVGKGLSQNKKARTLVDRHWLEAIDPSHRYGYNLKLYFEHWIQCESNQPFFKWLNVGDGRKMSIDECPRSKLQQEKIKYLVPKEREAYEVIVEDGKFLYKLNRKLLNTSKGSEHTKWIFVLSTSKILYVGLKKKGTFHHSSFLAGGVASAAGGIDIKNGVLQAVTINSGHYHPGLKDLREFIIFLVKNDVDITDVKICPKGDGMDIRTEAFTSFARSKSEIDCHGEIIALVTQNRNVQHDNELGQSHAVAQNETSGTEIPKDRHVAKASENDCVPMERELQLIGDETVEHHHLISNSTTLHKRKFEQYDTEVVPQESSCHRIKSTK